VHTVRSPRNASKIGHAHGEVEDALHRSIAADGADRRGDPGASVGLEPEDDVGQADIARAERTLGCIQQPQGAGQVRAQPLGDEPVLLLRHALKSAAARPPVGRTPVSIG
jgi:hypothetical protein